MPPDSYDGASAFISGIITNLSTSANTGFWSYSCCQLSTASSLNFVTPLHQNVSPPMSVVLDQLVTFKVAFSLRPFTARNGD